MKSLCSTVALVIVYLFIGWVSSAPNIEIRQNAPTCKNDSDCYPVDFSTNARIPVDLVQCTDGLCSCSECFMKNDNSNRCYVNSPCTEYDLETLKCKDNRRKTLTAFLLTFFLIPTGAANFYIDRLDFAIPQLLLGVIYIFCCCFAPCSPICAQSSKNSKTSKTSKTSKDDVGEGIIACLCIPYCLLNLLFFCWWIADLVAFGKNQRLDGDKCPLIDNLN